LLPGILDFYEVARCLFGGVGLVGLAAHPAPCGRTLHLADRVEKKKEVLERSRTLPRELEELDAPLDRTTLGAALDAGGARTLRSNTGRCNALYCSVNVLVNDGSDETRARLL